MNKKGFTVVELCVSFSLVSIIAIMLFNLIFSLKELYVSGDIKTTLLNKQGIMTKKIYEDLNNRYLKQITACGISCLNFVYSDGTAKFLIDVGANSITYDDYTMKLNDGTKIGQVGFKSSTSITRDNSDNNAVLSLDIPITTNLLENDDFGIHIVKLYDYKTININNNLAFENATIIANGITLELNNIKDEWTISNVVKDGKKEISVSTDDDQTENNNAPIFARIFHQKNGEYFDSYDNLLKSEKIENNEIVKLSSLKSLEAFRSSSKNGEIKEAYDEVLNDKDKEKLQADFQNGYFELIIDYPNIENGVGILQNYNRWIQTSNFSNNKDLIQSINIDTVYKGINDTNKWIGGLKYFSEKNYYISGSNNASTFSIASKNENAKLIVPNNDEEKEVEYVDIWVRANDYIKKYSLVNLIYSN